ncbi:MAG TPA: dTDP-4-dehydrorhamnose 3,5-epimerase [Solirubrobacteraceae bacterium]|nr:dTDP-4-dehydrorhamnose 3,5-epimerase [Solirubrobacteraceae bacterium]
MERLATRLQGPILLALSKHSDQRGFFCETYRRDQLAALGVAQEMVQHNHSRSREGVVRGLHYQEGAGIAKLVRCARGAIFDVVVDLRRGSPTFGQWEGFNLDEESMHMLYCPVGFAHGFCVTSAIADVVYLQSGYFDEALERTIAFDDPDIAVRWPLPAERLTVSRRDAMAPTLAEVAESLSFSYSEG